MAEKKHKNNKTNDDFSYDNNLRRLSRWLFEGQSSISTPAFTNTGLSYPKVDTFLRRLKKSKKNLLISSLYSFVYYLRFLDTFSSFFLIFFVFLHFSSFFLIFPPFSSFFLIFPHFSSFFPHFVSQCAFFLNKKTKQRRISQWKLVWFRHMKEGISRTPWPVTMLLADLIDQCQLEKKAKQQEKSRVSSWPCNRNVRTQWCPGQHWSHMPTPRLRARRLPTKNHA